MLAELRRRRALDALRLAISWCYPDRVHEFELSVREDERLRLITAQQRVR